MWRLAVIAVLVAAGFAVRLIADADPGPVFIAPVLAAAFWYGRRGGVAVGIASTVLYVVARELNGADMGGTTAAVAGYRLLVYCALGYAVGWLVEERRSLSARVTEAERQMAELQDLQEALAPPDLPVRPELELASCYVPAEGGAGGDFFLVAPGPRDSTLVVVGDVAGKGLAAAKRAAYVRMGFAAAAPFQDNPCRLLELANSNLIERAGVSDVFVTVACFVIKPSEGKITWSLAGHPPALILDDGRILGSVKAAFPLGIGEDIDCEIGEADLAAGQRLRGVHRRPDRGAPRRRPVRHGAHERAARRHAARLCPAGDRARAAVGRGALRGRGAHRRPLPGCRAGYARGSVKRTRAPGAGPPGSAASTQMRPPCSSTIARQIASPRPEPGVVRDESAR